MDAGGRAILDTPTGGLKQWKKCNYPVEDSAKSPEAGLLWLRY
jgi:hypothetical protein